MFWNKKPDPSPLGVPLDELEAMLAPTSIRVSRKDNREFKFEVQL
jgi:hypothetical protein